MKQFEQIRNIVTSPDYNRSCLPHFEELVQSKFIPTKMNFSIICKNFHLSFRADFPSIAQIANTFKIEKNHISKINHN